MLIDHLHLACQRGLGLGQTGQHGGRGYNKKGRCLLASAHKRLELRFKTFSQGLRQERQLVPLE